MPEDTHPVAAVPAAAPLPVTAAKVAPPEKVFLVSYPKVVFFFPTLIAALAAAITLSVVGDEPLSVANNTAVMVNAIFLCVFALNLVVISFDFPRTTSLTLVFLIVALVLGGFLLSVYKPDVLPFVGKLMAKVHPLANSTYYYLFAVLLGIMYIGVLIVVQFDYWEVRPNELLHHHGLLSDLKRYSAPDLRVDKEINDVFEYLLLRSGRLILHPSGEKRSIILDNVLFITKKETALTRMLGALQVQVRTANAAE